LNQEEELKKLKTEFAEETGIDSSRLTNAKLNNKMIEEAKRQMSEKY
jgi:hypothetical protein